ncbi:MAG: hypothetical protein SGJ09_02390 [Phycisphaerae bacterium]|nr:hypothetical protein [Phycisphaerae bacterium]
MAFFSLERRIAFIHVPKTGGTAIMKALESIPDAVPLMPHARARDVRDILSPETYATMTTIAVVREPFDWIGSYWRYMQQDENHPLFEAMRGASFPSVVRRASQLLPIGWRQTDYITDESGKRIVTHVLRFERLDDEWEELALKLDLRCDLPRLNESRPDANSMDCGAAERELLDRVLSDDFLRLGYTPSNVERLAARRRQIGAEVGSLLGHGRAARVRFAAELLDFGELDLAWWLLRAPIACGMSRLERGGMRLGMLQDPSELESQIPSPWWPAKPTESDMQRFLTNAAETWHAAPQRIV